MADDQTTQDLTRAIQALQQQMAQGKSMDPKEIDKLDKALKAASKGTTAQSNAQRIQTGELDKGAKGSVRFAGALAGTTRNVGNFAIAAIDAAGTIRESREQFSSLNGSIDIAAGMFKTTAKLTAGLGDAAGTAISAIPLIGPVIGGFVSGVSKAAAALAEATADIAAQIGKKITAEMDNANTAFRMMAQSGAVGADGLTGLANQAIQAGISFKDFASVTKESAHGLAFAFGDTATGAKKFADASEAMTPFRRELTALGVGAKQQNEMTANYIKLQARQGNIEGRSSQDLAQGSAEYIKRLTALSRLTGKSVEEQQKELDSQMSNARMVGALAEVQGKYGEVAASNMKDTAAFISGIDENIGKGLQDALSGNLGTEAAQQFAISAGEQGSMAVDMLRKGQISTAEASAMIQSGLKKTADNFGGPAGLGKLAGLGTPIENSILGLQKFSARAEVSAADFQKTIDKNKDLATTTDAATNNLVDSSVKMQKFATELDKISLKLMGSAGLVGAVGSVTDAMLASATEMNKMIAMGPEAYAKMKLGMDKKAEVETGDVIAGTGGGALAGAATGAAAGAMIGSVVPVLGTAIGALIGGGLGALLGGSGGFMASKEGMGSDMIDFDDDSWLGSLFNKNPNIPKKAVGGPVQAGKSYVVGENGPELLMSGMNGTVVPNAGPSGGSMAALGGLGSLDSAGLQSALAGNTGASAGGASSGNALAEAQINRLDQLITQMARSNSTNEEILQATRQ
jgi:hypothetical protein